MPGVVPFCRRRRLPPSALTGERKAQFCEGVFPVYIRYPLNAVTGESQAAILALSKVGGTTIHRAPNNVVHATWAGGADFQDPGIALRRTKTPHSNKRFTTERP